MDFVVSDEVKEALTLKYPVPEGKTANARIHGVDVYIQNLSDLTTNTIVAPPLPLRTGGWIDGNSVSLRDMLAENDGIIAQVIRFVQDAFPAATPNGQIKKVGEEYSELVNNISPENAVEECIDVIFASLGFAAVMGIDVETELRKKLTRNQSRKWVHLGGGVYKHVQGT